MGTTERKIREKERRRNEIVNAAEHVFFTNDFDQATMDDIADKAELSKGTLYLYFKSKEDLKFALFRKGAEKLKDLMKKATAECHTGLDQLEALGRVFIEFSYEYRKYFSLFVFFENLNTEKLKINEEQLANYITKESPLALVYECVEKGYTDGSLQNIMPAKVLATTLWSQLLGILNVIHSKKEVYALFAVSPEEILQAHFQLILNRVLKP